MAPKMESAQGMTCTNITRRGLFLTPSSCGVLAWQEADRKANAFFDGVLPPFSNIGNTGRGSGTSLSIPCLLQDRLSVSRREALTCRSLSISMIRAPPVPDAPTLRGIGLKADFSTANPTSAYDTGNFGKVCRDAPHTERYAPFVGSRKRCQGVHSRTADSSRCEGRGLTQQPNMICQAEIINKDVIANPITGQGPEAAAKKTLKQAAGADTYGARSLANFARWRRGEEVDETRRFDMQRPDQ